MFRHIVAAKFRADLSHAEIEQVVAGLRALPDQIEAIVSYEVGLDELHLGHSYDLGIVATFEDVAAQDRYQVHPAHVAAGQRLREASESVIVVDYEF